MIAEARNTANRITYPDLRGAALGNLAGGLAAAGREDEARHLFAEALIAVEDLEDAGRRSATLSSIALAQVRAGHFANALLTADAIPSFRVYHSTVGDIAVMLAAEGQIDEAWLIFSLAVDDADDIEDRDRRSNALREIAVARARIAVALMQAE